MGSQRARITAARDSEKTKWVWCTPGLLKQVPHLKIDLNTQDYGCQRYCKVSNKLGKCKETDVRVRRLNSDKFYHGKWAIVPI